MFTDSHCHLIKEYYENISREINEALACNVNRYINIGCDTASMKEVIKLVNIHKNMYGAIGIHPNEITDHIEEDYSYLEKNIKKEKIIAIGEIGLDYHYEHNKELQKKWFEKQLFLAERENLPVIIHSRDATMDTLNILKKYKVKGIIHSFSGSYETAMEYIKLGFILGINGVVSFSNSKLSSVIDKLPLEYIVLETDAPYLTPEPFRGKKNSPKYIKEIAQFICKIKGITPKQLAKITNKNLSRVFDF